MTASEHAIKSRSSLQLYLLLIAAVASLMILADTATPRRQAAAGQATGYGYSGNRPETLANHLEAIRLAALDPYREQR